MANSTNPLIPGNLLSLWELHSVGSKSPMGFYPYELNDLTNMSQYQSKLLLIARANSSSNINNIINDMSGFSAYIAKKIDTKYDNGMPYSGNIIGGQNVSQMGLGTGCTKATNVSINIMAGSLQVGTSYVNSNKNNLDSTGCVVGWIIKQRPFV